VPGDALCRRANELFVLNVLGYVVLVLVFWRGLVSGRP
jgi:hypothetical protein